MAAVPEGVALADVEPRAMLTKSQTFVESVRKLPHFVVTAVRAVPLMEVPAAVVLVVEAPAGALMPRRSSPFLGRATELYPEGWILEFHT